MDNTNLLVAMADECKLIIAECQPAKSDLPKALQPKHLLWMCNEIERRATECPTTQLHRWIGFIQCGMMANRMIDMESARVMFDKAKIAHGDTGEDLLDHLDTRSSFELDIGGAG